MPAGTLWREPLTEMRFVWVLPGRFMMGASKDLGRPGFDPGAWDDETPAHEVELPHGIWMAEHPVTNAQYGVFLASTKHTEPAFWRSRQFNAVEQPVVGVSFEDALAFCRWLTERAGLADGHRFDLPTEAEWEHAARGPVARPYPWGSDRPMPERACFRNRAPAPVGGRPAGMSPFGCHDMAGNVWEWCLDAWRDNYYGMPNVGLLDLFWECWLKMRRYGFGNAIMRAINPCHPGDRAALRVLRGGCWLLPPSSLRCAVRSKRHPNHREQGVGFRVVCRSSPQTWLVGA
jgi:formylglycine-generating enzyme required for sulfatase activity